jgi:hypothetical protein
MATKKAASEKKYGAAASKSVEREMKAMKQGKLKSGGSGKKVTNPRRPQRKPQPSSVTSCRKKRQEPGRWSEAQLLESVPQQV